MWQQRKGWARPPGALSLPQLGPGSPPGVWVCSTDMLLSVPPNPGEPKKTWDHLPGHSWRRAVLFLGHHFWAWPTAMFRREALGCGG